MASGGTVRGLTVQIGADTSKLGTALNNIKTQTNSLQKELRNVNQLLKFDPGNVDLIAQKQKLLQDSIANTKQKLDILKQGLAQMEANGVDHTDADFRQLQRDIVATERTLASLEKQASNFSELSRKIQEADNTTKQLKTQLSDVNEKLKLDPGNIDLIKQKEELLSKTIEATGTKLDLMKQKLKEMSENGVDETSTDFQQLQHEINQTEVELAQLKREANNFTELSRSVESLTKETERLEGKLEDVDKKLEFDPKNVELLKEKEDLLTTSIEKTSQKLEAMKARLSEMQTNGVDETDEDFQKLERDIAETEVKLKSLNSEMKNFGSAGAQRISAFGTQMASTGDKLKSVGQSMMGVSAGVTAVGAGSLKVAMDFDKQMSTVQAISGATGKDFEQLREKAEEMGKKTSFSATESAQAMEYMAMAGWKTKDMVSGIDGIMNAAAASGTDLARTSDIITDGLTAFGLSAKDSSHFADVLVQTGNNANTTVEGLGESFKYAGSVCGGLGISIEDASVALGLMANSSVKSSMAGTALRTGLVNLIKPTDQAQSAMDKYNLQVAKNADGTVDLMGTMQNFREGLKDVDKTEQEAVISTIMGKNAMAGWSAIINATDGDFQKLTDSIYSSNGAAEKSANLRLDNLSGQLTLLKSALEGIGIEIGETLTPLVSKMAGLLQNLAKWFSGLSDPAKELIVTIGLIVASIGPLLIIIGTLMTSMGHILEFAPKISTAFAGIQAPILPVIAVIGALIAIIGTLWQTNEGFRNKVTEIWERLQSVVTGFVETITGKLGEMGLTWGDVIEGIKTVWIDFCNILAPAITGVLDIIVDAISSALDIIVGIFDVLRGLFTGDWETVKQGFVQIFQGIFDGVTSIFMSLLESVSGILTQIFALFGIDITPYTQAIIGAFQSLVDFIRNIPTTLMGIWQKIPADLQNTIGLIGAIFQSLVSIVTNVFNILKTAISTPLAIIKALITGNFGAIPGIITGALSSIAGSVGEIFQAVKDTIQNILTIIINVIRAMISAGEKNTTGLLRNAIHNVGQIIESIIGIVTSIFNQVKNIVQTVLDLVVAIFTGQWGKIPGIISKFLKTTFENVKSLMSNILTAVIYAVGLIIQGFIKLGTGIISAITSLPGRVSSIFNAMKNFIIQHVTGAVEKAYNFMRRLPGQLREAISSAPEKIRSVVSRIPGILKEAISDAGERAVAEGERIPGKMVSIGRDIIYGIADGISGAVSYLYGEIKDSLSGLVDQAKDALGIASPSKVMRDEVGVYIVEGIIAGINDRQKELADASAGIVKTVKKNIEAPKDLVKWTEDMTWSDYLDKYSQTLNQKLSLGDIDENFVLNEWEALLRRYIARGDRNAENLDKIRKNIQDAEKSLNDKIYTDAQQTLQNLEDWDKITSAGKVEYWGKVLQKLSRSSSHYKEAQLQLKKAQEELNKSTETLKLNHLNTVTTIKQNLIKNISDITKTYDQAVKNREDQIEGSLNLFNKFTGNDKISKGRLTANLQSQVNALLEWDDVLTELSNREELRNSDLLGKLEGMGVAELKTLKSINSMTKEEMQAYVSLYEQKQEIASRRAISENEALLKESQVSIRELVTGANSELKKAQADLIEGLAELGLKATKTNSQSIGNGIIEGLKEGISSSYSALNEYLISLFGNITTTAKNVLEVHSPSKVFFDIGAMIVKGLTNGIASSGKTAINAMDSLVTDIQDVPINGATLSRDINMAYKSNTTDGLTQRLDRIEGVLGAIAQKSSDIYMDGETLVGSVIDRVDEKLGQKKMIAELGV